MWDRLVGKYTPHTALSLLKLKSEFHNSKLELIEKIQTIGSWIWKSLKFGLKGNVNDEDFLIHVLNNLPNEYDVILDGFENHVTLSGDDSLTIEVICEKFKHWYEKIKKEVILGAYNKQ